MKRCDMANGQRRRLIAERHPGQGVARVLRGMVSTDTGGNEQ